MDAVFSLFFKEEWQRDATLRGISFNDSDCGRLITHLDITRAVADGASLEEINARLPICMEPMYVTEYEGQTMYRLDTPDGQAIYIAIP